MPKGKTTAAGIDNPIRCRQCSMFYEKGGKPQKGQDDSLFLCDNCQNGLNREAAKAAE